MRELREVVETYDSSNKNYRAILYVALTGSSGAVAKMTDDTATAIGTGVVTGIIVGGPVGGGVGGGVITLHDRIST